MPEGVSESCLYFQSPLASHVIPWTLSIFNLENGYCICSTCCTKFQWCELPLSVLKTDKDNADSSNSHELHCSVLGPLMYKLTPTPTSWVGAIITSVLQERKWSFREVELLVQDCRAAKRQG